MIPMYFRNAQVGVLVYSVTDPDSFEAIETWLETLKKDADPSLIIFLVGNKVDLSDERLVSTDAGETLGKRIGALCCEVSAKTGYGIDDLFLEITREFLERMVLNRRQDVLGLALPGNARESGRKCC
jgi:Ras-related protein Rab-5C